MGLPDTRAAREAILGALHAGAPVPPLPAPDLAPYWSGSFGHGGLDPPSDRAALLETFEAAARGWHADVLRAGRGDWPQAVRAALDRRGCRRIAVGAGVARHSALMQALDGLAVRVLDTPIEGWKGELFDTIDAGVGIAAGGVAATGTLVLRPGPDEPRSLSLVPPVHVVVLFASTLHAGLPAALRALAPAGELPTNLLLVSGPSKTADIQQTLAYGAHGPKELVIVLADDLGSA